MKFIYYLLSYSWGLIMLFIGWCAAAALKICGVPFARVGPCTHFKVGECWGGISLGHTIITDSTPDITTLNHEFGHSIQNAFLGPFFIFLVAIPSATRYWIREFQYRRGKKLPPYESIWFERTATELGNEYISLWRKG